MSETAMLPSPAAATAPRAVVRRNRWGRWVDVALVGLTVAFAFLSGSFVARNSDLWLHLAAGRLIVNGQYSFGVDPFSYATVGRYWANHAWLSDTGMYLVHRSLGGGALVVFKAAIVALIASVMFWMARDRGPIWLRTSCILLAILAMTPRLLLQPSVISFFMLALCLGCLHAGGRWFRAVPILIVLWVNLDSWFVLGPLLVVLFWAGRQLDYSRAALNPWPAWLVPASLLACLFSPHHVFGLTLPLELSPAVWRSGFALDPRYANVFLSPWNWSAFGEAGGYNLASWSFVILIGLGFLSFALNWRALRSWRCLVWIAFAALACWQARLVPFFAVVAGPITALNLGELVPERAFRRPGRAALIAASLALVALAWLGWTVGFHNRERGAGWAIHTDATLARAATGIAEWREKNGIPPDRHVFTTHVDLGHYLAWFAPNEKSTLDSRLQLFGYDDYGSLSHELGLLPADEHPRETLKQIVDQKQIAAVALYDPDPRRLGPALSTVLYKEKPPAKIARVDGSCVLIVPGGSAAAFDPERMAFGHPGEDDVSAAGNGPAALAEPILPWVIKPQHGRAGSWEADAAAVYLWLFEERSHHDGDRLPPLPSFPLGFSGETLRAARSPARSPALPLLAVRAARRGAEIDPHDASAWAVLGRAYFVLGELTWEADAGEALTLLRYIRLLQATTAFVQAVLLNPDSPSIRQTLARLYWSQGALDLAHHHAADALRITRRNGPASGESHDAFNQRLARDVEFVDRLETAVMENENRLIIMTAGLSGDPLSRARIARQLGLHQKAIDTLMKSHPDLYGSEGIELLIELLIATGQSAEARVLLDRDEIRRAPDGLGMFSYPGKPHANGTRWMYQFPAYPWLNFCQYAAAGQYDRAESSLEVISELFERNEASLAPRYTAILSVQAAAEAAIAAPTGSLFDRVILAQLVEVQRDHLIQARTRSVRRADLSTLAGILELERGRAKEGEKRLMLAKRLFEDVRPFASSLPGLAIANRYLDALEHQR